jgi:hypothetical protein
MTPTLATDAPTYAALRLEFGNRNGLPTWAVMVLDGLIGSGIVAADALDGLDADQLTQVARRAMRRAFDMDA